MSKIIEAAICKSEGTEWRNDPARRVAINRAIVQATRQFPVNKDDSPEVVKFVLDTARDDERKLGPALHKIGNYQGYFGTSRTLADAGDIAYRAEQARRDALKNKPPEARTVLAKEGQKYAHLPDDPNKKFYGTGDDNEAKLAYGFGNVIRRL